MGISKLTNNINPQDNPVINSPYEEATRYWKLDDNGLALDEIVQGRRESASRSMAPQDIKKSKKFEELDLGFDQTNHALVNSIRSHVKLWREKGYLGASMVSKELLQHWNKKPEEGGPRPRLFFAQIEAIETIIWLTEVTGAKETKTAKIAIEKQIRKLKEKSNVF